MIVLSGNDYLEIKCMSLIADYDRETLINLYQPIIGYTAVALYFSLLSEANKSSNNFLTHSFIMKKMQINTAELVAARKNLEGVGLLKTFISSQNDIKFYSYQIFAPNTPKAFFENTLLYGTLIKALGNKEAEQLKNIYSANFGKEIGQDISATFVDAFNPDLTDVSFLKALNGNFDNQVGRVKSSIKTNFLYENFFKKMKEISTFNEKDFSSKEMKEIERISTLNSIPDVVAAEKTLECISIDTNGKRIDFNKLSLLFQQYGKYHALGQTNSSSKVSGNSQLASKINLMDQCSPKDYLSILQNGTKPALSDLKIVDYISKNYGFNNGVLNAIIDFVLSTNNNIFNRSYTEKIAASLARENINNAVDAMNFLHNASKRNTTTTYKKSSYKADYSNKTEQKTTDKKQESINWDQLLDELDGGGENGKA